MKWGSICHWISKLEIPRLHLYFVFSDSSGQHYPVILTGDLNTPPASAVYELLVRGGVEVPRDHHHGHGRLLQPDLGVTDTCQFDQSLATRRGGYQQVSPVINPGALDNLMTFYQTFDPITTYFQNNKMIL